MAFLSDTREAHEDAKTAGVFNNTWSNMSKASSENEGKNLSEDGGWTAVFLKLGKKYNKC